MLPPLFAAFAGHTVLTQEQADDIRFAVIAVCGTQDRGAREMGLDPAQFSRQLAGKEPLNVFRLSFLPLGFEAYWIARRAKRIGGEFISAEQLELLRGYVALGRRKMLQVAPELFSQKRGA